MDKTVVLILHFLERIGILTVFNLLEILTVLILGMVEDFTLRID